MFRIEIKVSAVWRLQKYRPTLKKSRALTCWTADLLKALCIMACATEFYLHLRDSTSQIFGFKVILRLRSERISINNDKSLAHVYGYKHLLSCAYISTTLSRHGWVGGVAPRILNLGRRRRWAVNLTSWPLYPEEASPRYPSTRVGFGEERNLSALSEIEPWFLCLPAPSLCIIDCIRPSVPFTQYVLENHDIGKIYIQKLLFDGGKV